MKFVRQTQDDSLCRRLMPQQMQYHGMLPQIRHDFDAAAWDRKERIRLRETHCRLRKCAWLRGDDLSTAHADFFGGRGFKSKCFPEDGMRQFPAQDNVATRS